VKTELYVRFSGKIASKIRYVNRLELEHGIEVFMPMTESDVDNLIEILQDSLDNESVA